MRVDDLRLPPSVERTLRFLDEADRSRLELVAHPVSEIGQAAEAFAARFAPAARLPMRRLDPRDARDAMAWLTNPPAPEPEVVERFVEVEVERRVEAAAPPPRPAAPPPEPKVVERIVEVERRVYVPLRTLEPRAEREAKARARDGEAAPPSEKPASGAERPAASSKGEAAPPGPEAKPFAGMDDAVRRLVGRLGVANVGVGAYLAGLSAESPAASMASPAFGGLFGPSGRMAGLFSPPIPNAVGPNALGPFASPDPRFVPLVVERLVPAIQAAIVQAAVGRASGGPAFVYGLPDALDRTAREGGVSPIARDALGIAVRTATSGVSETGPLGESPGARFPDAQATRLGQITLVAPDLRLASREAQASGAAVAMPWQELARGAGPLDEAALARLGPLLPAGARMVYPALSPGTPGAANFALSPGLVARLAGSYGDAGAGGARAAGQAARAGAVAAPGGGAARRVAASIVPAGRPTATEPGGLFGPKAAPLAEAGAAPKRGGALDFLGVPVSLAPSLAHDPGIRQERSLARSLARAQGGNPASPAAFGLLRQRLLPSVSSVTAEPDLPAWSRRANEMGLREASPAALLSPDARAPRPQGAAPQMGSGPLAQAVRPFAPALALAEAAGGRAAPFGAPKLSPLPVSSPEGASPRFVPGEGASTSSGPIPPFAPKSVAPKRRVEERTMPWELGPAGSGLDVHGFGPLGAHAAPRTAHPFGAPPFLGLLREGAPVPPKGREALPGPSAVPPPTTFPAAPTPLPTGKGAEGPASVFGPPPALPTAKRWKGDALAGPIDAFGRPPEGLSPALAPPAPLPTTGPMETRRMAGRVGPSAPIGTSPAGFAPIARFRPPSGRGATLPDRLPRTILLPKRPLSPALLEIGTPEPRVSSGLEASAVPARTRRSLVPMGGAFAPTGFGSFVRPAHPDAEAPGLGASYPFRPASAPVPVVSTSSDSRAPKPPRSSPPRSSPPRSKPLRTSFPGLAPMGARLGEGAPSPFPAGDDVVPSPGAERPSRVSVAIAAPIAKPRPIAESPPLTVVVHPGEARERPEMPVLSRPPGRPVASPAVRVQRATVGAEGATPPPSSQAPTGSPGFGAATDGGARVQVLAREVYGILRRRIRDELERSRPTGRF